MSYLDEIHAFDIASIPGYLNRVTLSTTLRVPKFDNDPSSTIDHVTRFATDTTKAGVVQKVPSRPRLMVV